MKNIKDRSIHVVHAKFARIVELYGKLEKLPRSYGTDEHFTSPEIHLIETIGDHDDSLSVTELANLMGVTKGAISQRLKKLDKRGLTKKKADPENTSRVRLFLTSKGKSAYFAHKHWHEKMDGGYMAYYKKMDDNKIQFLIEYMTQVEDFLQRAMDAIE